MYSDRNFEIRPEYVDPEEIQTNPSRVFIAVVILFAVLFGAAFLGWLWSFTQVNPSTSTSNPQRSQHEYFQEQRRSPARSGGGERSGNPPAERSTATQRGAQEAPEDKVVVKEKGALAPSFQWVCLEGKVFCALKDPNGSWIQSFSLENGQLRQSEVNPNTIRPRSWSCQTGGPKTKMYCTIQDMNGQFLEGILYDGKVMREFKNAESKPMASGVAGDGREFSTTRPGTVQEWGQGGFPRVVTVSWTENLPNGCRRLDVTVPAGGTASVFGSSSRGAPLDTIRGPAVFVLQAGQCVVSGTLDVCLVRCGSR